jgi:hypothetical protein
VSTGHLSRAPRLVGLNQPSRREETRLHHFLTMPKLLNFFVPRILFREWGGSGGAWVFLAIWGSCLTRRQSGIASSIAASKSYFHQASKSRLLQACPVWGLLRIAT